MLKNKLRIYLGIKFISFWLLTRVLKRLRKRKWRLEGKQTNKKNQLWADTGKIQGLAEISILRNRRRGHLHLWAILKENMVKRLTVSLGPRASAKQDTKFGLCLRRGSVRRWFALWAESCGALYKQAFAGMLSSDSTAIYSEWKKWQNKGLTRCIPIFSPSYSSCS